MAESKENRHGLRSPVRPDLRPSAPARAKGLSAGWCRRRRRRASGRCAASCRAACSGFWPLRCGSPPEPPSPKPSVEEAVRPEQDVAAVVVGEGLVDGQHLTSGRRVDAVGGDRVLVDARVAVSVRVADVEVAAVGREGQVEQPPLAPAPSSDRSCRAPRVACPRRHPSRGPGRPARPRRGPRRGRRWRWARRAPDLGQLHRHPAEVGGRRRAAEVGPPPAGVVVGASEPGPSRREAPWWSPRRRDVSGAAAPSELVRASTRRAGGARRSRGGPGPCPSLPHEGRRRASLRGRLDEPLLHDGHDQAPVLAVQIWPMARPRASDVDGVHWS